MDGVIFYCLDANANGGKPVKIIHARGVFKSGTALLRPVNSDLEEATRHLINRVGKTHPVYVVRVSACCARGRKMYPVYTFVFIPFIFLALLSRALPSSSNSDPGHIAGPPPSPLRYVLSFLIARRTQHFLPSSTRVELWYIIPGSS